jgi:hypothetical protein
MNDLSPGLPPGWPTDEHRARVEARTRALRSRRLALRTATTALVVVLLAVGAVAVRGRSGTSGVKVATGSTTTTTTHRPTARAIQVVPAPNGWRIVDYGDARLAVPPGWTESALPRGAAGCPPDAPAGVVVFRSYQLTCSSILIEPIYPGPLPPRAALTIHGIKLYLVTDTVLFLRYSIPALGVSLTVHGVEAAQSLLDTLTSSSRRVVLSAGTAPAVPRDWHTVAYGGITLRVPPTWPIKRLGPHDLSPGECLGPPFRKPGVFLGKGDTGIVNCPLLTVGYVAIPTDGVWISAPDPQPPHSYSTSLVVGGLRLWVDRSTDPVLTIQPQRGDTELPALVHIGLGADPAVARTILYSIRATDRPG